MDIETRIDRSCEILDKCVSIHNPSHLFALFSGGHDSLAATHLTSLHPKFSGVVHLNTGIGVKETREFVRKTCQRHDWDLIEMYPDQKSYEELVLEKGFPRGPKSHNTMYYYLKQRQIQRLVKEKKTHWRDRIAMTSGIRKDESTRRMKNAFSKVQRRHGAQLWISPILYWSALDVQEYIDYADLERNEVVDTLHRSGECLCGALANPDELKEIEYWYPEAAEEIYKLEEKVFEKNLVDCKWACSRAPGKTWDEVDIDPEDVRMPLCSFCESRNSA